MISDAASAKPPLKRWTIGEYHRLITLGALTPDDHVELIEGEIVAKRPQNPTHYAAIVRISEALRKAFASDVVRVQGPITLADSEPEPDVSVAIGPAERYDSHHPGAEDLRLVVEVASTSLPYDDGPKAAMYARAGIAALWVADVSGLRLIVRAGPRSDGEWTSRDEYDVNATFRTAHGHNEIIVASLFARL